MLNMNKVGFFPYTPATQMMQGLAVAIDMLHEEGLDNVFARHRSARRSHPPRGARLGPGDHLPRSEILLADRHGGADAGAARRRRIPRVALEHLNISYGASFGPFAGKMFRIGHLGDINEAMLLGGLSATEMALSLADVPHKKGGVQAAMDYLVSTRTSAARQAAE